MILIHTENERRLYEMSGVGFVIVDERKVNVDDLLGAESRPGAIIRVRGRITDAIQFVAPTADESFGCVAGWISEADE